MFAARFGDGIQKNNANPHPQPFSLPGRRGFIPLPRGERLGEGAIWARINITEPHPYCLQVRACHTNHLTTKADTNNAIIE